jgi:hypothetical protein
MVASYTTRSSLVIEMRPPYVRRAHLGVSRTVYVGGASADLRTRSLMWAILKREDAMVLDGVSLVSASNSRSSEGESEHLEKFRRSRLRL